MSTNVICIMGDELIVAIDELANKKTIQYMNTFCLIYDMEIENRINVII